MFFNNPTVYLTYARLVNFDDFAVVGHESVHLYLHIGCLGVDGSGEPIPSKTVELFCVIYISVSNFLRTFVLYVPPASVWHPQVSFGNQTDSSVFAKYICASRIKNVYIRW